LVRVAFTSCRRESEDQTEERYRIQTMREIGFKSEKYRRGETGEER
jgi:ribonuclease E